MSDVSILSLCDASMPTERSTPRRPPRRRWLGPGMLVTAAFIGPGSITVASRAGAEFGFALLWVVPVATFATLVLQTLAAHIGLVARLGLGQVMTEAVPRGWLRWLAAGLVIVAVGLGNAAYQTGNLTGARLGLEIVTGRSIPAAPGGGYGPVSWWPLLVAAGATLVLISGSYQRIERVLIAMVIAMSGLFLVTAVLVSPDMTGVLRGLWPQIPTGSGLHLLALLGTTMVPYNLFLHASLVQHKWGPEVPLSEALAESRRDSLVSISIGGLISMAIMVTAAVTFHERGQSFVSAADMARQLEPTLGSNAASWLFGCGLLAAGATSGITAPLAAAIAIVGVTAQGGDLRGGYFRWLWGSVMAVGAVLAGWLTTSPTHIIMVAQAANALLLPLTTLFLIVATQASPGLRRLPPAGGHRLAALVVLVVVLVVAGNTLYRLWL
jgi:manganese transport protein